MGQKPDHGGTAGSIGSGPGVRQIAFLAAMVAVGICWPMVKAWIPSDSQFGFVDLALEHWAHRHQLQPWLDRRWAWLALHDYHFWFALTALPGVIAVGCVRSAHRRTIWPLFKVLPGWSAGAALGYLLYLELRTASWPLAVMMPATFALIGGAAAARMAARRPKVRHIRGTEVRKYRFGRIKRSLAIHTGKVTLAGVPLAHEDETRHIAAIGMTGSGKSTALRALMADAIRRGDRHVVADPEGSAMEKFFRAEDTILNPFDPRCAKWDLLSEIEGPSDYAFIAQSLLPHLGIGEHDQWISYAQQVLGGVMENFVRLDLGTSDDLIEMLASAGIGELKELCSRTPAARYFEEGGERMLASILGTLAPTIGSLRSISSVSGERFSIRRWVRGGSGSLWMPYAANQVAAVRGLISCWMNIAILETLSLEPSAERRIWFHIDELDALGRIEGLNDAQARLRKFGGCVAIGFQSFAQVKQVYGEGAHTIVENCGNLLLLRSGVSGDGGTAKLASDLIGPREIERHEISNSRTQSKSPSHSSSSQVRRLVELARLTSELTQLKPHECYLRRASDACWFHVTFKRGGGR
jgi:hypothetical protein